MSKKVYFFIVFLSIILGLAFGVYSLIKPYKLDADTQPKVGTIKLTPISLSTLNRNKEEKNLANFLYTTTNVYKSLSIEESKAILSSKRPLLLLALVVVESHGDPLAISKTGALGVCQIQPKVWLKTLKKKGLISTRKELFDPTINIRCANYILEGLLAKNDLNRALNKYSGHATNFKEKVYTVLGEYALFKTTN